MGASARLLAAAAGAAALLAAPLAKPAHGAASPVSGAVAAMPLWADGRAELSVYRSTAPADSGASPPELRVLVGRREAEAGSAERPVPALEVRMIEEDGRGGARAFRVYLAVDDMRVLSLAAERRGAGEAGAPARVTAAAGSAALDYRRRAGGGREPRRTLPWGADATCYDALPAWLRGLNLATPASYPIRLLPGQLAGIPADTALVPATVLVRGRGGAPSATSRGTYRVDVRYGDREDHFHFHPAQPHLLLRWERADGTVLALRDTRFTPEWDVIEAVGAAEAPRGARP